MIENVSTQLTVFHCFAHCLLPGRAFASLYALLFLEKEAEIGGRGIGNPVNHLSELLRCSPSYTIGQQNHVSRCSKKSVAIDISKGF